MSKLDNLFLKVISDKNLVAAYDIDVSKYPTLEDGRTALHPQVRAIAETIALLNIKISDIQAEMRIRNKVGPVVLDDMEFLPIYRRIVSMLSK